MKKRYYLLLSLLIFIIGCGGGGTSSSVQNIVTLDSLKYNISIDKVDDSNLNVVTFDGSNQYLIKSFNSSGSLTIKATTPSNIYVVLTNASSVNSTNDLLDTTSQSYLKVLDFRKNLKEYLTKETNLSSFIYQKRAKSVGDSRTFYLDIDGVKTTSTTLRLTRTVNTKFGDKTLNIYVSNDSFDDGSGCQKSYCVTQDMVDAMADKFLQSGLDNDIYDWETNIYGEEWGADASKKYSNLIGQTDEITILLTDIDDDNDPNKGVIGYFWAKDNMTNLDGSNQEIMFYIDSVMYANRGNEDFWSTTEKMPMEVLSTLAHEFQHMISFYQKSILRGGGESTSIWLDETLSCATEYLLSSKIKTYTPRQISYDDGSAGSYPIIEGQFPYFNKYINQYTLTSWSNTSAQYGGAYALGAYILQNYGGAKLLHNIMQNNYLDENAILEGIKLTTGKSISLENLFNGCGVGITLSDKILDPQRDNPFIFNSGDYYCQSYNDSIYCMGSINFYNYFPQPNFTYQKDGTLYPNSNRYLYLENNAFGTYNISLNLGSGVIATVIIKE